MKISASETRVGNLIEYQGKLWRVLKKEHVKPGKGGAFAQLEMKGIADGTKLIFLADLIITAPTAKPVAQSNPKKFPKRSPLSKESLKI